MGRVVHGARRVEEQALEERVVEEVEQPAGEAHHRQPRQAPRPAEVPDAEAHGGAGQVEPAPGGTQQQVPGHAVKAEGGPQEQEAVDLPGAPDAVGLVGGQEQQAGDHADTAVPQARTEVVQAGDGDQAGQQSRHEQRDGRRNAEPGKAGNGPHEQRRLVRIQFAAAMREQPVAALDHLPGDQREAGFVRRPRVAKPESRRQDQQGEQPEQPGFATKRRHRSRSHRAIIATAGYAFLSRA